MNRNFSLAVAAAILSAVPCAARPASAPSPSRRLFQAYYHQMDVGYGEHDLTKAFSYYSDDFTAEDENGEQIVIGDMKGFISDLFDHARLIHSTSRITGMTYQAHGYSMTVQEHMVFTGVSVKTGQLVKVDAYNDVRDFWTKTPDGWRLLKTRVIRTRGLWDGHKVTDDDLPDSGTMPGSDSGPIPGGGGSPAPAGGDAGGG